MPIVYSLQSIQHPGRYFLGRTTDLKARVSMHNRGGVFHTAQGIPWKVVVAVHFPVERKAIAFERYLKSASGRAFAKAHFESPGFPGGVS